MSSSIVSPQPIAELMRLGFSEYEARAYCALLTESPATGYRIAKNSGIPQAKIYETLSRLLERDAIEAADSLKSKGTSYIPVHFKQLLAALQSDFSQSFKSAEDKLKALGSNDVRVEVLWRIVSQDDLIDRARALTHSANETLHVALWQNEFETLLDDLHTARRRGVEVAVMLYGRHPAAAASVRGFVVIEHNLNKGAMVDQHGRQFIVVADARECIAGTAFGTRIDGVYTANKGIVTNAMDLVNHEIYLERILSDIGAPVTDRFGKFLERLVVFDPPAKRPQDTLE